MAAACLLMAAALPPAARAAAYSDLAAMSLEELANIEITSVSKKKERMSDAAASVYVITNADIGRSGVTSLPEALRLAPNLQLARIDARNYAVTARGFNSAFSNKLLMLIDGRSIYTPLFSGVFWDAQDVMLEDIDRIEVISGAGGTMWGANAVNGVINVVTRRADETQGTLLALGGGELEQVAAVRHGSALGEKAFVRGYAKHAQAKDTRRADSTPRYEGWHRSQTGVRADLGDPSSSITLQSDVYSARLHQKDTRDIHTSGASVSGQLRHRLQEASELGLQVTLDCITRDLYAPASPIMVGGTPQFIIAGGPRFDSEIANVFEIGYRGQLMPTLSYSVTAFHADYDRLRTAEPNPGGLPGTFTYGNGAEGRNHGVEMWSAWQVAPDWRISGGLVSQSLRTRYRADSQSAAQNQPMDDSDPHHYWTLRSSFDMTERTALDVTLRHVGQLRTPAVPSYEALDVHLAWRVKAGLEVSLTGQNLLDDRHPEFAREADRSEFERTVIWQL